MLSQVKSEQWPLQNDYLFSSFSSRVILLTHQEALAGQWWLIYLINQDGLLRLCGAQRGSEVEIDTAGILWSMWVVHFWSLSIRGLNVHVLSLPSILYLNEMAKHERLVLLIVRKGIEMLKCSNLQQSHRALPPG